MFYESDAMFDTSFDILVVLFFVCFFGVIGYVVVKVVVQWNRNNHSPLINVPATVIAKRADVSSHRYANANDFSGLADYECDRSKWEQFVRQMELFYQFKCDKLEFKDISYGSKISFEMDALGHFLKYKLHRLHHCLMVKVLVDSKTILQILHHIFLASRFQFLLKSHFHIHSYLTALYKVHLL